MFLYPDLREAGSQVPSIMLMGIQVPSSILGSLLPSHLLNSLYLQGALWSTGSGKAGDEHPCSRPGVMEAPSSPSLCFILISVKGSSRAHPEDLPLVLPKPPRPFPYASSCLLLLQVHRCNIYLMLPHGLRYLVTPFYPVTLFFCPSPRKGVRELK